MPIDHILTNLRVDILLCPDELKIAHQEYTVRIRTLAPKSYSVVTPGPQYRHLTRRTVDEIRRFYNHLGHLCNRGDKHTYCRCSGPHSCPYSSLYEEVLLQYDFPSRRQQWLVKLKSKPQQRQHHLLLHKDLNKFIRTVVKTMQRLHQSDVTNCHVLAELESFLGLREDVVSKLAQLEKQNALKLTLKGWHHDRLTIPPAFSDD